MEEEVLKEETNIVVSNEDKVEEETQNIINDIINTTDNDKLKDLTYLFNMNQVKKNAVRINKLETLLNTVEDNAIKRFQQKPHEFTNKELLDYMSVVQNSIDRATKSFDTIQDKPMLQINNQTNKVNININTEDNKLSNESRNNILSAIKQILKTSNQEIEDEEKDNDNEQTDVIDVESSEIEK